ncbi:scavenger receptor class B member 1 isoform X2 [Denticeps clupeoides]|uniref:Scavenger receptor class B member 1 n=1 Tax=Denticeps clupeoides TaxID=299321 RepID=A0AAY4BPR1_9TELE|nr:scavenger receptor class B member 1 isoform X2 [Denticeps clupeoides]
MAASVSKISVGLLVAGIVTAIFGIVLVFVGPIIVDDQIVKNVEINPKNDLSYTMWKDIPVPFFMSVYFYHVLNPKEILKGEKPMVEQRGPYVYSEKRQKENITFHDNHTVSYREYRRYFFEESMSVGNESDVVTIPNMLVLGASVMMEDMPLPVRLMLSTALTLFKEEAFLTKPVGELMWGYDSKLVDFLNQYLPGMLPTSGKFGLFAEFNNSNTGLFTVFTGKDDIRKVHKVDFWNGLKKVDYWRTEQCNMINGTAGQMWPPFMTTESTLPFYSPDACRSMELVFQRKGKMKGIPLFRFVAPKTLFANGTDYPPNEGFCPCRQSGLLNVSSCRHNSPVFMSHPHFYNADPALLNTVIGLSPSEEEHGLFIDIHPETGVPLNVSIKLQLNLYIKRVLGIIQTDRIAEVVMPMIWFEERGYIDGSVLTTFYNNLVVMPALLEYMQYIFIGLGLLFILVAVVLRIREQKVSKHLNAGKQCDYADPKKLVYERTPLLQE